MVLNIQLTVWLNIWLQTMCLKDIGPLIHHSLYECNWHSLVLVFTLKCSKVFTHISVIVCCIMLNMSNFFFNCLVCFLSCCTNPLQQVFKKCVLSPYTTVMKTSKCLVGDHVQTVFVK